MVALAQQIVLEAVHVVGAAGREARGALDGVKVERVRLYIRIHTVTTDHGEEFQQPHDMSCQLHRQQHGEQHGEHRQPAASSTEVSLANFRFSYTKFTGFLVSFTGFSVSSVWFLLELSLRGPPDLLAGGRLLSHA